MRWRVLFAAMFLSSLAAAQDAAQALQEGQEALARGAVREAIERYEFFADRGVLHPDVSYNRGVAYLARARESSEKPGDLGKAAAAFEEALLLRPGDDGAEAALEAVRAEVARRRARSGATPEVAVSPGALRAFSGLLPENGWALLAAVASLVFSLGLAIRKARGAWKLASGVALGTGVLSLCLGGAMAAYARHLRQDLGVGVVVVDEARVVDEHAVPIPGKSIPEAAKVEILERKGGLLQVRWGEILGYTGAQNVRWLGFRNPLSLPHKSSRGTVTPETPSELPPELARWVPEIPWLGVVLVELATGRVLKGNGSFFRLIGYTQEDLENGRVTIRHLLSDDSMQKIEVALHELKMHGTAPPIEGDYTHRDGSLRHVWITGILLEKYPGFGVAYALDQTTQRKTMQALRESDERARRFAQASFEGLFLHDKGRILDTNELLPAMFGTTREAMIGHHATEFTDPTCHPLMIENVAKQYELPYELIGRRSDGTTFPVEVLGKPIPVDGGLLRVTAVRDITERKRTEMALREAEGALLQAQKLESLGVLAGGIAHDFNNLLAIIASHVAMVKRQFEHGEDLLASLHEIDRAVARAAELSRQMLVYSGRSPKQIVPLQLNELLEELGGLFAASFPKKIQFKTALDPDCPVIAADRAQIEQVLLNLLTNAAEAIGESRGNITLKTSAIQAKEGQLPSVEPGVHLPAGTYAVVVVADSGVGMDASTQIRIFDPFFSTKQRGRGLGLSAMQGILRGHQGGLRIESAPGHGTSFEIFFPALPLAQKLPAPPVASPAPRPSNPRSQLILVVDDERALRRAVRQLLELEHYQIIEAETGVEATEIFRQRGREISLVLLDLMMPEMDGGETLAALRLLDPAVRVIISSGFDATETLERVRGEVSGVLSKPFRASELIQMVQDALDP